MLLKVMLLLLVMVQLPASVTGAVAGKIKAFAPVSEIFPPKEIAVTPDVKIRLVRGAVPPTMPPKVTAPVPGVRVRAVAPLMVLVAPENRMFWLPAVLSVGDPDKTAAPVTEMAPLVVVVILLLILIVEAL